MKTVLILGAAGQIPSFLIPQLLKQTDFNLKLYARNATSRLHVTDPKRETVIDGDFNDHDTLNKAMDGVDAVYLNEMRDITSVKNIIEAMDANHVRQFIGATVLGIEDEVKGAFGQWNTSMIESSITKRKTTAKAIEDSDLTYTLLRLAWLYNKDGNTNYELTESGEPFGGTEVTRQAVAQLIIDILNDNSRKFTRKSIGVNEPNTKFDKPSFY
ncbi:NAD(P)H-binding protein [Lentilactobacillus buchneri]|uniref:NAD(P)-binding domain-containing protein n=1 Tax=Lentilactobacillus buchneri DSM 20057 TaxID=1423728 RepID=A0A4R5NTP1_LENBU|nr:NAD(P)H-binding protein [Lentilactobacillus buchneri]AEB74026.1 saccharopine dehydrogenase [Lentilactobacillus buchneri NRRL B-30929]KRK68869.1 saccharopine dehydrogenase [Lentilactobacillus buchneri DSM 20057]MCT2883176.1 NAD-dependent epimerase/dehydratase family protein [Lentilactobacillus buchneri]MCT2898915.1 NAD-dependent epimerase/dehydratase family protein [Lentilactobacillus buchneri]MCT3252383.1 NAD-dependent epimerase/dehydratase family protein [Lentilactobacillus buchneri]